MLKKAVCVCVCVCECKQSLLHLEIAQRPRSRLVAFVTIFEVRHTVFT